MWFAVDTTSTYGTKASLHFGTKSQPLTFQLCTVTALLKAIQSSLLPNSLELNPWKGFVASLPPSTGGYGYGNSVARALYENCPNAITDLHFDLEELSLGPPDISAAVPNNGWYEHGVLRGFEHRQRR